MQGNGPRETIFTMEATPIKYGPGASEEIGWETKRFGLKRVMLVSDPGVVKAGIAAHMQELLEAEGIEVELWDRSSVEPTSSSFQAAADFAKEGDFDGFVAVGGGSSMDTAKIANLISTHGGEIMDYVNPPIGGGRKPPGPLKTLICVPTTAGTGSEATTAAILDIPDMKIKTGISHAYLRPARGVVDPLLTRTAPAAVTSSAGLDVVCHAAESYLTLPFDQRPKIEDPDDRPPYQGANPVADMWSAKALEYGGKYLRRAVASGDDIEARGYMMLGASLAGVGFGSAGVHIPHACAYPIAGLKHEWTPTGYPTDHPFVPHGWSVIVTAPAAFRFTYDTMPERHHEVANLLAGEVIQNPDENTLPEVLIELMRDIGAPTGVRELGYSEDEIPQLVEGAIKQQRLLIGTPKEVTEEDLANIIRDSMENW
ncbi:hydroxyacid-oxoacid transhydrogenase [Rubrobacter indicoceani]|uniref:hydroxyacid-oxoacid transhydrogenase n=1 Tax=Rubrobacter indicoceani TaxID=2051957 RepID=UPI000E5BFB9E|nr:hydroxyacid-oxoacid transhydrogenase [Rubrobacter indicoceani]